MSDESSEVLQARADRTVLRVGDAVRHPPQPWSASVHLLLAHLQEQGFTQAPAPGPLTADHDDVGFIPGISGDDACGLVQTDDAVAAVASLLRRYHDAVEGWQSPEEPRWFDGQVGTGEPGQLVCHGDVAPWNLVWRDGELVGLIDWEYATIGTRRDDIAYALHFIAPFRDRTYWRDVLGMTTRPRRRHRISVFAEAYGIPVDESLVDDVLAAQRRGVELMKRMADAGHERHRQLVADGELEREQRAVVWGEGHRHRFLAGAGRAARRQREDRHPGLAPGESDMLG